MFLQITWLHRLRSQDGRITQDGRSGQTPFPPHVGRGKGGFPYTQRQYAIDGNLSQRIHGAMAIGPPDGVRRKAPVATNLLSVPIDFVGIIDGWDQNGKLAARPAHVNALAIPGVTRVPGMRLRTPGLVPAQLLPAGVVDMRDLPTLDRLPCEIAICRQQRRSRYQDWEFEKPEYARDPQLVPDKPRQRFARESELTKCKTAADNRRS